MFKRIKKAIKGEWRYIGERNRLMDKHVWKGPGGKKLSIYQHPGVGGYRAEIDDPDKEATQVLTNGVTSRKHALILGDMAISDGKQRPAAFMHSDRASDDYGPGSAVRQDTWLRAHARDYEFETIDPSVVE